MLKKILIILFVIIIAIVLVSTGVLFNEALVDMLGNDKKKDFFSAVGSVGNLFMAIAAIFNMGIILYFYLADKQSRKNEQKLGHRLYWYRTVILEKNIDKLENFFDDCIKIIHNCNEALEKSNMGVPKQICVNSCKTISGSYPDEKLKLRHGFIEMIQAVDIKMGEELNVFFDECQNEFIDKLQSFIYEESEDNIEDLENIIYKQKARLLGILYNYGLNGCEHVVIESGLCRRCISKIIFFVYERADKLYNVKKERYEKRMNISDL